jgi:nitrogen regulatory protein P-II 1
LKKIDAFIRHQAFEPIPSELLDKGLPSHSISEVKGSGCQKGLAEAYRGSSLTVSVRPKLKLEVVVADGKIFVLPVEEAIRIRTGEEGEDVLQAHSEEEIAAGAGSDQ